MAMARLAKAGSKDRIPGRFSRPPLERMMRLHDKIKAGAFPNCQKLARELEVSAKTIQRDIDFMRDRLGLPIEYDQLQFGFCYTEPVANFPNIEVSQGEIMALFVARKALEQYRGTSFERSLRTAFQKISDGLRDKVDFQWGDVDAAISFRGLGTTAADIGCELRSASGAALPPGVRVGSMVFVRVRPGARPDADVCADADAGGAANGGAVPPARGFLDQQAPERELRRILGPWALPGADPF